MEVMAFFTVTVDTETEGDLENTATPTHPSLSMRRRDGIPARLAPPVKLNQRQPLAHRGGLSISASVPLRKHRQLPDSAQDSLRPSPKACISHHRRPLPSGPLCLKSPRIWH
ncbi:hypothetical protein NQZ68_032724 [Dissostichus eleginoides]|nr:hypothetical protein NQZ68_032724 [Dissostichus eleginoides]